MGLGPVLTAMCDTFGEAPLVAESTPTGGEIADQMIAGVADAADPVGGIIQRFTDALTAVSSVDRNSLRYQAGNELIGPMSVTGISIGRVELRKQLAVKSLPMQVAF